MKVKAKQSFSDSTLGFVAEGATVDVDASTLKRVGALVEQIQVEKAPAKTATPKKKPAKKISDTPGVDA